MARIDRLELPTEHNVFEPTAPMLTDHVVNDVRRERGQASFLVLSQNGLSIKFTRSRPWTRPEAERLARAYDYDRYAWQNVDADPTTGRGIGAGVMTGLGSYVPVARRQLAVVA